MPRRAAHWVQTVTVPPASSASSRSASGAACGSSNPAARPGSANQVDSPVSHNETGAPALSAVAATVNACAHRSGASAPAVALTTSVGGMRHSIGSQGPVVRKGVSVVTEIGFVSLLVAGFGGLAGMLVYAAVRTGRGR